MRARLPISLLAVTVLTGCASVAIDQNFAEVERFAREQTGSEVRWLRSDPEREAMRAEVDRLLAQPLAIDDAVRIALGYSPAFQSLLAEAAVASADATGSARIGNPVFTFERLFRSGAEGRELDIGRSLGISLFDLLFLPARLEQAEFRQQQTRLQSSIALLSTVTEVRQAWVDAVAARQVARYREEVATAAGTAAELARRMQATGNFSRLQRAREQALAAEETANLIRARQNATAARETLIQRLGLTPSQAQALRLPDQLPALPEAPMDEATAGAALLENRLDVRIARTDLDRTAKSLGLTRVTSVVNGLHVAGVRNSETGESTQRGFELELPLPLFDLGDAARAGGEARYLAAFNRTLELASNASSQVRVAYEGYRSAYDLARHYRNEVVPLRQNITEESVLQYNGMLIGVFELLAAARAQSASVVQAIEAERDFWRAEAGLKASLLGQPIAPLSLQSSASPAASRWWPLTYPETIMTTRRSFLAGAGLLAAAGTVNRAALAALPEPVIQTSAVTAAPLSPPDGRPYDPVVTLNGWTCPGACATAVKEFHLVAEPVEREIAPGMVARLWGYNGQSPGPTIEVVEGDRVRIFVTNRLPEHTTIHWHGQRLPNGMDGVGGLNQPQIPPGKTFVYEFVARRPGTFMYHPHADEMVQMAMGMMGFLGHASTRAAPAHRRVDRDFCFLLNAYDIEPGSYVPKINTMLDFNLWTWNSRAFPGIDSLRQEGRPGAGAHRQPDHDQPPDPHPRPRVRGYRAPTAGRRGRSRAGPRSPPTSPSARCARSSSSPTRRAIGRCTATSRTTP
jgi:outer membrane protein TolC